MNKNDNTLIAGAFGGKIENRHEGKRELIDPFILPPDYKPGAFSHSVESGCSKHEKQDEQNSVKEPDTVVKTDCFDLVRPFLKASESVSCDEPMCAVAPAAPPAAPPSNPLVPKPFMLPSPPDIWKGSAPTTYRRNAPNAMELEKLYLSQRLIRTKGNAVYIWNGNFYRNISMDELKRDIKGLLRPELEIRGTPNQLHDIIECILAEPTIAVRDGVADPPHNLLNVANGLLDLNTMTLLPPAPQYFFTSAIKIPWDTEKTCPVFEKFLFDSAGGDPILVARLWEALGYILTPDNRGKRFCLLLGPSSTGKSVFGNTVRKFFNPEFLSSVSAIGLGAQFSLSALLHSRVNLSMDLTDAALTPQAVSIIKSITGRDAIAVEEKYQPIVNAVLDTKLVFSSNHVLKLMAADSALLSRVLLLPFRYPVPKERQNPHLEEMIGKELPGILHRAVSAYVNVVNRGYIFTGDDIYQPAAMEQSVLALDSGSDSPEDAMCAFIADICVSDKDAFTPIDAIHAAYRRFANANPAAISYANTQTFARMLRRCFEIMSFPVSPQKKFIDGKTANVYFGVRLKQEV